MLAGRLTAAAGAAGLLVGFAVAWLVQGWRADAEVNSLIAAQARDRAVLHEELAAAERAARQTEQEWANAQAEIQRAAQRQLQVAVADRRAADRAHVSLLDAARAAVGGTGAATCGTGAAGGSPAAGSGLALLPDVLGEIDAAAGELAAALDEARIAGHTCERAYDALKAK